MNRGLVALTLLALALWVSSCSENQPPEGEPLVPARTSAPRAVPTAQASPSGLQYSAPSAWVAEPTSSSMRLAQFRLPRAEGDSEDAELVVYYFGGGGGSVQANIERWIGQFRKTDGGSAKGTAEISERNSNGLHVTIVDVSGTYNKPVGPMMMGQTEAKPDYRMLAAVLEGPGGPWFLKFTGPRKTVAEWEGSFQSFVDSSRVE